MTHRKTREFACDGPKALCLNGGQTVMDGGVWTHWLSGEHHVAPSPTGPRRGAAEAGGYRDVSEGSGWRVKGRDPPQTCQKNDSKDKGHEGISMRDKKKMVTKPTAEPAVLQNPQIHHPNQASPDRSALLEAIEMLMAPM